MPGTFSLLLMITTGEYGFIVFKGKNKCLKCFKFKALVENQSGKTIKCLRMDNGGEYCNYAFESFCESYGIKVQRIVPYTPQQNGVDE